LLGKWFAANPEKRNDVFLATKFANRVLPGGGREVNSTPQYCKEACAKSLKRLGVDHIDLYYCHRLDRKTPIEHTVRAMAELKAEGKIKYLGLSECSAGSLRRACKVHHIDAVQIEYSPWALDIEDPQIDLLHTAREFGVAIVAYSPIGRGMLSGTIRSVDDLKEGDFRRMSPRFSPDHFSKNLVLVDQLAGLAKEKGCTPTQLCLAWLMAQGEDIIPIPGTTKLERLKENLGSLQVKLTGDEERKIRKACEEAEIHGGRYPEVMKNSLFADTPAE
jgi:aryl-alcohol dehydrogenase-like predicted oxidoreductase